MSACPRKAKRHTAAAALGRALLLAATLIAVSGCGPEGQAGRVAKVGDVVSVHFSGRRADGSVFETTRDSGPRQVHVGANLILPAFEQALVGLRPGEQRQVRVPAAEAFGPRREDEGVIQVLERARLPDAGALQVDRPLQVTIAYPDGSRLEREVRVIAVDADSVTVDANHPLAGEDLLFDIELVAIH